METLPSQPEMDPLLSPQEAARGGGFEAGLRFVDERWVTIPADQLADERLRPEQGAEAVRFGFPVVECTLPNGDTVAFTRRALSAMLGSREVPGWPEDGSKKPAIPDEVFLEVQERFMDPARPEGCPPIDVLCTGEGDIPETRMASGIGRNGYRQVAVFTEGGTETGGSERLMLVMEALPETVRSDYGRAETVVPRGNIPVELLAGAPGTPSTAMWELALRAVETDRSRVGAALGRVVTSVAAGVTRVVPLAGSFVGRKASQGEAAHRQQRSRRVTAETQREARAYLLQLAHMVRAVQDAFRSQFRPDLQSPGEA